MKKITTVLSMTLLAASAVLAGGTAAGADEGPAALVGPVLAPVEANGVAGDAAQHVNSNVCDTTASVLGEGLGAPRGTDCTASSTL